MVREGRDCEAIVTQMMAARAALDKASALVIGHYLDKCFPEDYEEAELERVKRVVTYLIKISSGPTEHH